MFGQIEEVYQALHHNGEVCFEYKDISQFGRITGKNKTSVYSKKKFQKNN